MKKSDYENEIKRFERAKESFDYKLRALEIIAPYIPPDDRASALAYLIKFRTEMNKDYSGVRRKWWDFNYYGPRRDLQDLNERLNKLIDSYPNEGSPPKEEWFTKEEYKAFRTFTGDHSTEGANLFLLKLIVDEKVTDTQINQMIANAAGARLPDDQRKKSVRNTLITIGILSLVVVISAVLIGLTYGGITPVLGSFLVFPYMVGLTSIMGVAIAAIHYPSNKNEGMAAILEEVKNGIAADKSKKNKSIRDISVTGRVPIADSTTMETQRFQSSGAFFTPAKGASGNTTPGNTIQEDTTPENTTPENTTPEDTTIKP